MKKIKRLFFLKNLARLLIPMLIPILFLGSLLIFIIQSYLKEEIKEENLNVLKLFQTNVELIFNELDSIHLNIAASAFEFINLQTILQKEWLKPEDFKKLAVLKNYIDSPTIARPYIDSIYIHIENNQNRFLTSTTGGVVNLSSFDDTSWYQGYINYQGEKDVWTENRIIKRDLEHLGSQTIDTITMYHKFSLANGDQGVIVLNLNANFLNEELENLTQTKGQKLWILNQNGTVLFANKSVQINMAEVDKVIANPNSVFSIKIENEPSMVFKLPKNKYDWYFVSTIPMSSLYEIPIYISKITLLLLSISIIVGISISYYMTKKNYEDVRTIMNIINRVEKGESLPPLPSRVNDVYSYIINGILKNFMEHSYLRIRLAEKKYKAQVLELAALQSQLNPHFLFNTLETINWKIFGLTKGPSELTNMIEKLADILRYSLDTQDTLVSMGKEITYTKSYIEIQKIRYRGKFDVIWDYDANLENHLTLRLFLQPLVENSLYHGIKVLDKKSFIKIKIKEYRNHMHISVIDNGAGIVPDRLEKIKQELQKDLVPFEHIGLYNTHKRLQLTFGKECGLQIKSKVGWGTIVSLFIPKMK